MSLIDLDLDALGYIHPRITINLVQDGQLQRKKHLALPVRLVNIVRCKSSRCITSVEDQAEQIFHLADAERRLYRCVYCEQAARKRGE